jgi:hypothetical protein
MEAPTACPRCGSRDHYLGRLRATLRRNPSNPSIPRRCLWGADEGKLLTGQARTGNG